VVAVSLEGLKADGNIGKNGPGAKGIGSIDRAGECEKACSSWWY
jgi:hypothetical protein